MTHASLDRAFHSRRVSTVDFHFDDPFFDEVSGHVRALNSIRILEQPAGSILRVFSDIAGQRHLQRLTLGADLGSRRFEGRLAP